MALNFIFKQNTNGICEVQESQLSYGTPLSNIITQVRFSVFNFQVTKAKLLKPIQ